LTVESQWTPGPLLVEQGCPPASAGQLFVPQAVLELQLTSHWHELVQSTVPHASAPPLQVTSSAPAPETMSPHAVVPVHVTVAEPAPVCTAPHAPTAEQATVHDAASVQSTLAHEAWSGHVIAQFQPAGHAIAPPLPVMSQVRVARLHALPWQMLGHASASAATLLSCPVVPTTQ
jgi:hypothetical protein